MPLVVVLKHDAETRLPSCFFLLRKTWARMRLHTQCRVLMDGQTKHFTDKPSFQIPRVTRSLHIHPVGFPRQYNKKMKDTSLAGQTFFATHTSPSSPVSTPITTTTRQISALTMATALTVASRTSAKTGALLRLAAQHRPCHRHRVGFYRSSSSLLPNAIGTTITTTNGNDREEQHRHRVGLNRPRRNDLMTVRTMSMLPEALSSVSVWGGTGILLKSMNTYGGVPYWLGFSFTNIMVRTTLFPFVLQSAHTSVRFAKVAPEVQFLITIFQNDLKKQRQDGASPAEQRMLLWRTMQTLGGIYRLRKVNPLAVFISPLLQLPVFWYVSIDLRKIINGQDPHLASELMESGLFWFKDLTEPDPWFALPVLSGLLLYYNVEVAVGKQSLSGETASQSNMARILKDSFQCELQTRS